VIIAAIILGAVAVFGLAIDAVCLMSKPGSISHEELDGYVKSRKKLAHDDVLREEKNPRPR
jgi:hypothetical protein